MFKVFIDGEHGTTGLLLKDTLNKLVLNNDIDILHAKNHRDKDERRDLITSSDISVLCLPDDAAREMCSSVLLEPNVRLIDTSTAHRTDDEWVYGFPELLQEQSKKIAEAKLVSNPGCYATAAIAILRPLTNAELLPENHPVSVMGVSGYSGGGKELIAKYENDSDVENKLGNTFSFYSLNKEHKHIPEIKRHAKLKQDLIFLPSVINVFQGMIVAIPVSLEKGSVKNIHEALSEHYSHQDSTVSVQQLDKSLKIEKMNFEQFIYKKGDAKAAFSKMVISVTAAEQNSCIIIAELDNLGKGAAFQAFQNLKLMLGVC
jgi:N-acetyl-gamma-glutamyl-phosphate reductase